MSLYVYVHVACIYGVSPMPKMFLYLSQDVSDIRLQLDVCSRKCECVCTFTCQNV